MVWTRCLVLSAVLVGLVNVAYGQEEPPLPSGLASDTQPADEPDLPAGLGGGEDEPALPSGLGGGAAETQPAGDEPALPAGLGDDEGAEVEGDGDETRSLFEEMRETLNLTGFWEIRGGIRTQRDSYQRDASIGETRLQLEVERLLFEKLTFKLTADVVYDGVLERHAVDLERGEGFLDLRSANVAFTPVEFMDVRIGRQILTWGTGDLLFLNDLFPKDWQSFFIGRDVEYLKAPSDAIKVSLFSDLANLDIVFTPRFDADRFIRGERISYYNPLLRRRAGRDAITQANRPNDWFRDHEWAARVSKNIRGVELAGYGYWGYWKSPAGQELPTLAATFPRLSVYGASVRGTLWGGVANLEAAYYDSREDRAGTNRFIDNSQVRLLAGYERQVPELMDDLTVGGQYYIEWMMDHDAYERTRLPFIPGKDECRQVLTFRVTKLLMNQNLTLSFFAFYSPTDADAYLRPSVSYKLDDHWTAQAGANVFLGDAAHTFFNQFARNTNVYLSLRYGF